MKTYWSLTLIFLSLTGRAQTPDTLFTNGHHNVALFFPDKIRQAVVGAENFLFSHNQEHPQFFGLLKGTPGKASNLLAITQDGHVYSYALAYKEELPQVVYFLEEKASLGKENKQLTLDTSSIQSSTNQIENVDTSPGDKNRIENWAKHFYSIATGTIKKKKEDGISLQINDVIYKEGEVYLVMEIANNSGIDLETETLRIFLSQGNKSRNSSYQKILQQPILKYNFPQRIGNGDRKRLVYVFPKFTVGEKERLEIELRERNGNRFIKMFLNAK